VKQISSRDNPQFKSLRALSEDSREVRRQGRTLLDGIHLVSVCLERSIPLQQLIVSESSSSHPAIQNLLADAAAPDVIQLTDALFQGISGVASPVGIAAVMTVPAENADEISGDVVVLDAVQDAGNVGAILRTAAAAGVRHAVLGKGCAGAWLPRVLRAGQGAHFSLRICEGVDLPAWLAELPGAEARSVATVARAGVEIYSTDLRSPAIWLLGNEGAGLSPQLVQMAGRRVTIPLAAETESLNVAAAAAVCLFEAVRQRRIPSPE
jgi:TrmH family RNA methyltransferase